MDLSYRRAMLGAQDQLGTFLLEFVTSPISLVLSVAVIALLVSQTPLFRKRAASAEPG
jgi:putative tricarboxylic transport membrane protein